MVGPVSQRGIIPKPNDRRTAAFPFLQPADGFGGELNCSAGLAVPVDVAFNRVKASGRIGNYINSKDASIPGGKQNPVPRVAAGPIVTVATTGGLYAIEGFMRKDHISIFKPELQLGNRIDRRNGIHRVIGYGQLNVGSVGG